MKNKKIQNTIAISDYFFALGLILACIYMNSFFITKDSLFIIYSIVFLIAAGLCIYNKKIRNKLDYEKEK